MGLFYAEGPGPDPGMVAGVIRDLAEIVGSAHRLKPPVVHRDLKPANILLQEDLTQRRKGAKEDRGELNHETHE